MSLAGASLAVVPVPADGWAAPLPKLAALAWPPMGAGAATGPEAAFASPAELAELLELPAEHPARNVPPASMTLPIMRPAMAPCRVRPVRVRPRAKLPVFSMPL
jgi:hypothetical protein